MKRFLAATLLALLALAPLRGASLASIQQLVMPEVGLCSTFSVNAAKGYWVTAAHCVLDEDTGKTLPEFRIAGDIAKVVAVDRTDDLALLEGPSAQALRFSPKEPQTGDDVFTTGFPLGIPQAITTRGTLLLPFFERLAFYDLSIAPGASGSPIMTKNGVVGTANLVWPFGRYAAGTPWRALKAALVDTGWWTK